MARNAAEEFFLEGLYLTRSVPEATTYAATRVSTELGRVLPRMQGRSNILDYAVQIGLRTEVAAKLVPNMEISDLDISRICRLVINEPGSVINIPSSQCIQGHLPPGRLPTIEELQSAIAACSNP